MTHYSHGNPDPAALLRMVEELVGDSQRKSANSGSVNGPKSTLGIVLNGTVIDFMIPGGPAHEEEVLESRDEVLEVDGFPVDASTVNQALKGTDDIGSMVRLSVRKADDGKRVDVVLKRTSLTYIHHMQVYLELMDQLKGACKRNPDLGDVVRRLASKIKELDSFHSSVEHELRKTLRKFSTALPQIADMLRSGGGAPTGALPVSNAQHSAETQRVIDRLQYQLQVAEENQTRLKQQLETHARMSPGGHYDDDSGMGDEIKKLQGLLYESQKDKDAVQFRADQMSRELNKLKMQVQEGGSTSCNNPRLSEIR